MRIAALGSPREFIGGAASPTGKRTNAAEGLDRTVVAAVAGRACRIKPNQSRFSGSPSATKKELAAKDHPTTNPGAQGQQHHVVDSFGGSQPLLTEHSAIAIVGQRDRSLQACLQPLSQRNLLPAREIDADLSHPGTAVHRTGKTYTNRIGLSLWIEGLNGFHHRRCDGTGGWWLGRGAVLLRQELACAVKATQLEAGATDIHPDHLTVRLRHRHHKPLPLLSLSRTRSGRTIAAVPASAPVGRGRLGRRVFRWLDNAAQPPGECRCDWVPLTPRS